MLFVIKNFRRASSRPQQRPVVSPWLIPVVLILVACGIWATGHAIKNHAEDGIPDDPVMFEQLPPPPEIKREMPKRFPRGTCMPAKKELVVCGGPGSRPFDPAAHLVTVYDQRVWWESDSDKNDTENDHEVHRSLEKPLRKVVEEVCSRGAILKVYDSYRPAGIHVKWSLHREGRAVDLTVQGMSMEELAKICWVAGFDWVFYEKPRKSGEHIHCSVRAVTRIPNPSRISGKDESQVVQ